jgi:hypothetical protein
VINIFEGDPKLTLGPDGATITYIGGQPIMDQGINNLVLISLFTRPGWSGNLFLKDVNEKIGSDFLDACSKPITLSSLNDIRQAAELALKNPALGDVKVTVLNPVSTRLDIKILISPPGKNYSELLLQKNGLNWLMQSVA